MFVFVIMPFSIGEIYEDIIKPTLEADGCEVVRGDAHVIPRNIVKDILHYLDQADLVIADLTSQNSNVFYELGLAHAFRKPTFMITQDNIMELPFDLKSYRTYQYSFNHKDVNQLKDKLHEIVKAFHDGRLTPESPVTDFLLGEKSYLMPTEPSELMDEAEYAYEKTDYRRALSLAEAALQKWPKKGQLYETAGRAALRLKKTETAIKYSETLIRLEPTNWLGHRILADAYMEMGEWARAIPILEQSLELASGDNKGFVYNRLGRSYENLGDLQRALIAYQNAEQPSNPVLTRLHATRSVKRITKTMQESSSEQSTTSMTPSLKLIILEALWGSDKGRSNGWDNVTQILRNHVMLEKLKLVVCVGNLGDPNYGVQKSLKVKYSYNGIVYEKEIQENETLKVPDD